MKRNIRIKIYELLKMFDVHGYIFVGAFLVFLLNIGLYIVVNHVPSFVQDKVNDEQPYYFSEGKIWYGELTEIAVSDDILYVLYDDKGIMECYDLDGNYLCSYGFPVIRNGKAAMQVIDNVLYVRSREGNVYSFSETQFLRFYSYMNDRAESNDIFEKATDDNLSSAGVKYEIRGASVWREMPEAISEKVISRPEWMVIMRESNIMYTHIICVLVMAVLWVKYGR